MTENKGWKKSSRSLTNGTCVEVAFFKNEEERQKLLMELIVDKKIVWETPEEKAKDLVHMVTRQMFEVPQNFSIKNVKLVWFSKTLQNWKALATTNLPDNIYYEVTYNGDKKETYVDVYSKIENIKVPD